MLINEKTSNFSVFEEFSERWCKIKLKNGDVKKIYIVDVDGESEERDIIIYNDTGSDSYGDAIPCSDSESIEVA